MSCPGPSPRSQRCCSLPSGVYTSVDP